MHAHIACTKYKCKYTVYIYVLIRMFSFESSRVVLQICGMCAHRFEIPKATCRSTVDGTNHVREMYKTLATKKRAIDANSSITGVNVYAHTSHRWDQITYSTCIIMHPSCSPKHIPIYRMIRTIYTHWWQLSWVSSCSRRGHTVAHRPLLNLFSQNIVPDRSCHRKIRRNRQWSGSSRKKWRNSILHA